jgi:hypothetical protein
MNRRESANTPARPASIMTKVIRDCIDIQARVSSSQMLGLRYNITPVLIAIAPDR